MASQQIKLTLFLVWLILRAGVAAEVPDWVELKKTKEGEQMLRIGDAIYAYQERNGDFPETLFALVSKGFIKERDIVFINSDGSISVPTYFKKKTSKFISTSPMLRIMSKTKNYWLVVNRDLSLSGEALEGGGKEGTSTSENP